MVMVMVFMMLVCRRVPAMAAAVSGQRGLIVGAEQQIGIHMTGGHGQHRKPRPASRLQQGGNGLELLWPQQISSADQHQI